MEERCRDICTREGDGTIGGLSVVRKSSRSADLGLTECETLGGVGFVLRFEEWRYRLLVKVALLSRRDWMMIRFT